jgi:hypothetical protein
MENDHIYGTTDTDSTDEVLCSCVVYSCPSGSDRATNTVLGQEEFSNEVT